MTDNNTVTARGALAATKRLRERRAKGLKRAVDEENRSSVMKSAITKGTGFTEQSTGKDFVRGRPNQLPQYLFTQLLIE